MSHKSKISRKSKPEKFTVIDNGVFNDSRMSLKATGLLCLLLSFPPDWQLYVHDLKNRKSDGRDSVQSGISELIELGYVARIRVRNSGQFKGYDYEVYDCPQSPKTEKPFTGKPETGKPETENPQLLNTKENKALTEKEILNKERDIKILKDKFMLKAKSTIDSENIPLPSDQLIAFFDYWTEPDIKSGLKLRYEMQKTWDFAGRLRTWERNYRTKFGMSKDVEQNNKLSYEL